MSNTSKSLHWPLYLSSFVSHIGMALALPIYAQLFATYTSTKGAFGYFFMALALPPVLLRPLFQHLLQRTPHPKLLITLQVIRASITFGLAYWSSTPRPSVMPLCLGLAGLSLCNDFFVTALGVQLPLWVHQKNSPNFLSRSGAMTQLGWLTGFGSVAFGLAAAYPIQCLCGDGIAYLLSAGLLFFRNQYSSLRPPGTVKSSTAPLKLSRSARKQAVKMAIPSVFLGCFHAVVTPLTLTTAWENVQQLGLFFACSNAGMLVLGLSYPYLKKQFPSPVWTYPYMLSLGCFTLAGFLWSPPPTILAIMSILIGILFLSMTTTSRSEFYQGPDQGSRIPVLTLTQLYVGIGKLGGQVLFPRLLHHPTGLTGGLLMAGLASVLIYKKTILAKSAKI